jgi:hypothetical protein
MIIIRIPIILWSLVIAIYKLFKKICKDIWKLIVAIYKLFETICKDMWKLIKAIIKAIYNWLHPQPEPCNDGHRRHHRRIKRKRLREEE